MVVLVKTRREYSRLLGDGLLGQKSLLRKGQVQPRPTSGCCHAPDGQSVSSKGVDKGCEASIQDCKVREDVWCHPLIDNRNKIALSDPRQCKPDSVWTRGITAK